MTERASVLQQVARSHCLPHLLAEPGFQSFQDRLSFVLVGSVATGTCHAKSDIDIAIICDPAVLEAISAGTDWQEGRPSETSIEGVQLHHYGIAFDAIDRRLRELDDEYLYVYGNALVLRDPGNRFTRETSWVREEEAEIRKQRIEGKLDMLLRRSRGLEQTLEVGDLVGTARVCLELITRCLKLTALLDRKAFDPRKRLFATATEGEIGRRIDRQVRRMFSALSILGEIEDPGDFTRFPFMLELKEVAGVLSEEARSQGYCVGLEHPDRRQIRE